MHDAVLRNGALAQGETVLIQGASTSVGLMGLQLAKLKGARLVIGTSTTPAKRARLSDFGADIALDTNDDEWADRVVAASGGGADLIVDMISAGVSDGTLKAARLKGRIVNIGRLGGMSGRFDFDLHALKRIRYLGGSFRARTRDEVHAVYDRVRSDLMPAVAAGRLRLPVDRTFALATIAQALDHARSNAHFGKIIITI
jgi:NADPH2:quinone reductase